MDSLAAIAAMRDLRVSTVGRVCTIRRANRRLDRAVYPKDSKIVLFRNVTAGITLGSLWYDNRQQFMCRMQNCTQYVQDAKDYNWYCTSSSCECTPNSAFCGGPGVTVDLSDSVRSASGDFRFKCPIGGNGTLSSKGADGSAVAGAVLGEGSLCTASFEFLAALFPDGLSLPNCKVGECALPSDEPLDANAATEARKLTAGEITGVVITGGLVGMCAVLFAVALVVQGRNRRKPVPPAKKGASLAFESIRYVVGGKKVLGGVSGVARAGRVFAIMGPSGAGKSTFLDIIAGKAKSGNVHGRVTVDGQDLPPAAFRSLVGYVDQEDLLMPTLTVRETLMFSATLRLPESIPRKEKQERVDAVIKTLGLSHVADSKVGSGSGADRGGGRGISGGERRRVSIGVELVTSPSILMLDEPTSGLDSFNAFSVVRNLADLARVEGKTVIFTIHQPRSDLFHLFDDVLVLTAGHTLYCGGGAEVNGFLRERGCPCPEGYNVADHLLDLAMGKGTSDGKDTKNPVGNGVGNGVVSNGGIVNNGRGAGRGGLRKRPAGGGAYQVMTAQSVPSSASSNASSGVVNPIASPGKATPSVTDDPTTPTNSDGQPLLTVTEDDERLNGSLLARMESGVDNAGGTTCAPSIVDPTLGVEVDLMNRKGTGQTMVNGVVVEEVTGDTVSALNGSRKSRPPSQLTASDQGEVPVGSVGVNRAFEVGFMTQLNALMGRACRNLVRNLGLMVAHLVLAVVLGVFVGLVYFKSGTSLGGIQNRLGSLMFLLALLGFSGISAIGSFAGERALYVRERAAGFYGTLPLFITKLVFDIFALRVIPAAVMGSIVFTMIGLTGTGDHFPKFMLIVVLFSVEIGLLCLAIAIAVRDVGTSSLVAAIVILFKMLFSGLLINQDSIPLYVRWVQFLSFFRFAYEALIVNDITGITIVDDVAGANVNIPASIILTKFGFNINSYYQNLFVGVGLTVS
ncbi:hypothetical protein HDU97_001978, partial [Phlyctochytrium planicorne]